MTDPDRRLASRAGRGDRRALVELYECYRGRLLGFLVRQVGDRETAEDVFQEVWIKVMQAIESYRPEAGTFRAWLFRVAANAAVDRLRRERRHAVAELDAPATGEEGGERAIDRLPTDLPDPEQYGAAALLGRRVDEALAGLNERQRSAVLLRHQQGLTYRELGDALGIPEGTAKTMVHRAVLTLRDKLGGLKR